MRIAQRAEAEVDGGLTAAPRRQCQALGLHGLQTLDMPEGKAMSLNPPGALREDSRAKELMRSLVDSGKSPDMEGAGGRESETASLNLGGPPRAARRANAKVTGFAREG